MLFGAKQAVTVLATTEQEGSRPSWPQHEIPLVGVRQVRSGSDMPTIAVPNRTAIAGHWRVLAHSPLSFLGSRS